MKQTFYWTARYFENGQLKESRYFKTQAERDQFVLQNEGWKKRGKICSCNLEKHLQNQ